MDIKAFKALLFDFIENHECACVYEHSCTEKEVSFSVYIGSACFLVKCTQISSAKSQILR